MNPRFTDEDRKNICKDALFLFSLRNPKNILNQQKLRETHLNGNPVARIKSKTSNGLRQVSNNAHYDSECVPSITYLCVDARVALTGSNICPEWGLFNGSIGTVKDIVFDKNKSPNRDDLPAYVLVEFAVYQGPVFDPKNPKVIPIVPIEVPCNQPECGCKREFVPLKLSFAKTCHTFQGQNVGPVADGQPPNAIQTIVCDPGTCQFEGKNPGLFYTILSRVTSLGDYGDNLPESDRFKNSAIYFIGQNMNKNRIRNITLQANGLP